MTGRLLLLGASLFVLSAPANAAQLITNGSFETATGIGSDVTLAPGATNLTGWTVIGSGNLLWCVNGGICSFAASDGKYYLDLTGLINVAPYAGVKQSIATLPGASYTLSFDLGARSDAVPVGLTASAGATSALFSTTSAGWTRHSLAFVATGATTLISLVGASVGGSGLALHLDQVSVVGDSLPEPADWALMLAGLGLVGATLRQRRAVRPALAG